jgi:hypothetical protein
MLQCCVVNCLLNSYSFMTFMNSWSFCFCDFHVFHAFHEILVLTQICEFLAFSTIVTFMLFTNLVGLNCYALSHLWLQLLLFTTTNQIITTFIHNINYIFDSKLGCLQQRHESKPTKHTLKVCNNANNWVNMENMLQKIKTNITLRSPYIPNFKSAKLIWDPQYHKLSISQNFNRTCTKIIKQYVHSKSMCFKV